jgi:hypothetical protein
MAPMSSSPATTQPQPPSPGRRKRELLGPTGLIVMVVAILAFTAVAIAIELASNRGKTFKATVSVLGPVEGSQNEVRLMFRVTNVGSRAGRPDKCEAVLYNISGERVTSPPSAPPPRPRSTAPSTAAPSNPANPGQATRGSDGSRGAGRLQSPAVAGDAAALQLVVPACPS